MMTVSEYIDLRQTLAQLDKHHRAAWLTAASILAAGGNMKDAIDAGNKVLISAGCEPIEKTDY